MTSDFWLTLSSLIISLITGIGMLYIAVKKTPHENTQIDSTAVKNYAEAAQIAAQQMTESRKEITQMRDELVELKNRLQQTQLEVEVVRKENADLRNWAERLVHQVQSLGGAPVQIQVTKNS